MELGALLCTPRNPRCDVCPLRLDCSARRQNRIAHFPALPRRAPGVKRRFAAFVLRRGNCYLVRQRPAGVVNAHLWEFPNLELANGTLFHSDLLTAHVSPERRPVVPLSSEERGWGEVELLFRFMERCSNEVTLAKLCSIKHTITRYRITLDVFHATLTTPSKNSRSGSRAAYRASLEGRWLTRAALRRLAFTSAHKKILGHLAPLKS